MSTGCERLYKGLRIEFCAANEIRRILVDHIKKVHFNFPERSESNHTETRTAIDSSASHIIPANKALSKPHKTQI